MNIVKIKPGKQPRADNTRQIAFHRMIPNLMTLTAMAAGLTSLQYALNFGADTSFKFRPV